VPIQMIDSAIRIYGQPMFGFDTRKYVQHEYGQHLYDNQTETFDIITNPNNHDILLIEARGGGKTYSVAISIHYLCSKIDKLNVAVFAPRFNQSKRLLDQIFDIDNGSIDHKASSTIHIVFKNGSEIWADSANEKANIEGGHPHIVVIDERHKCSDIAISNKIIPMLGAHSYYQYIEMGVALGKGDFFNDSQDPKFKKVIRNWLKCDRLKESGIIKFKGVEYPEYVVGKMPWEKKLEYFGQYAEKLGKGGGISIIDFITQYELTWLEDIEDALTKAQKNGLKSGIHEELHGYDNSGIFVFGLDTAGGSVNPETLGLDYTALSIWVLRNEQWHKIACFEWQGPPMEQYDEIIQILKLFKVQRGCIDYSNIGIAFVDMLIRDGISAEGIMYQMSDKESHKNLKMAMFEYFQSTTSLGKAKYPLIWDKKTNEVMVGELMYKHYIQWTMFQRKVKNGKTIALEAPSGDHDDGVNADMLAIWAGKNIQKAHDPGDSSFDFVIGNWGIGG